MRWMNQLWKLECEGWKYLYVQDRCNGRLPQTSGVYCFVSMLPWDDSCSVVYVGKSYNFSSRLKFPHTLESKLNDFFLCYIQETNEPDQLEIDFIKRYRPKFNVHHNG